MRFLQDWAGRKLGHYHFACLVQEKCAAQNETSENGRGEDWAIIVLLVLYKKNVLLKTRQARYDGQMMFNHRCLLLFITLKIMKISLVC